MSSIYVGEEVKVDPFAQFHENDNSSIQSKDPFVTEVNGQVYDLGDPFDLAAFCDALDICN